MSAVVVVAALIVTGLFAVMFALNVEVAATVSVSADSDPTVLLPSTCKSPDKVRPTPCNAPVNIGAVRVLLASV